MSLNDGLVAYWSFENDLNELVSGTGPDGGDKVTIVQDSKVGNGAAKFDGSELSLDGALFYDLENVRMDEGEQWTYTLWLKTEDPDAGFIFGMSFSGEYVEGAKGLWLDDGLVNFDVSWVDGTGADIQVNDNQWHNIAVSKGEEGLKIYVDGVLYTVASEIGWSSSEGTVTTIGTAIEAPDEGDWPGVYHGLIDDIRFYDYVLTDEEIANIYNGQ